MNIDPSSRLEQLGPANLGDDELLSFLLCRGAVPGPRALASARNLLADCAPAGLAALGLMSWLVNHGILSLPAP